MLHVRDRDLGGIGRRHIDELSAGSHGGARRPRCEPAKADVPSRTDPCPTFIQASVGKRRPKPLCDARSGFACRAVDVAWAGERQGGCRQTPRRPNARKLKVQRSPESPMHPDALVTRISLCADRPESSDPAKPPAAVRAKGSVGARFRCRVDFGRASCLIHRGRGRNIRDMC